MRSASDAGVGGEILKPYEPVDKEWETLMPKIRNQFHELGNWHNKISMGAIIARESLDGADKFSRADLGKVIGKVIKILGKIESYVHGADRTVNSIKSFVYEKMGGDTEILPEAKQKEEGALHD